MITSDPKITGLRNHIKVSSTKLPPEAIGLMNIDNSKANEFNVEKTEKKKLKLRFILNFNIVK